MRHSNTDMVRINELFILNNINKIVIHTKHFFQYCRSTHFNEKKGKNLIYRRACRIINLTLNV